MFYSQNDHSLSLFDQTVRDADEEFYATFPDAREALARLYSSVKPPYTSFHQSHRFTQVNGEHHSISSSNYALSYHHSDLTPLATPSDAVSPSIPISLTIPSPSVSNLTDFPERLVSMDQIRSRDTPSAPNLQGRKMRRTLRSPISQPTNNCERVMRLEDLSEPLSSRESGTQFSLFHTKQRRAHSLSHPPPRALTWDPILSSSRSPTHLSPLSNKRQLEKKPPLACLFCRGRKIACGPPLPGSLNKTCNQCQRRSLRCEYPSESRRGMRKKKSSPAAEATPPDN